MIEKLRSYLPEAALNDMAELLTKHPFRLIIKNERKTKRGDFRATTPLCTITINNNLTKEQFLITLVHEIAHLHTHIAYPKAKPHGKEWKQCFQKNMLPFLNPQIFNDDLLKLLAKHFRNPKATIDSDPQLSVALQNINNPNQNCFIFDLKPNQLFKLENRTFKLLNKRRTRYECMEISTKKTYLVKGSAPVKVI